MIIELQLGDTNGIAPHPSRLASAVDEGRVPYRSAPVHGKKWPLPSRLLGLCPDVLGVGYGAVCPKLPSTLLVEQTFRQPNGTALTPHGSLPCHPSAAAKQ